MLITNNANSELRFYCPLSYLVGSTAYTFYLKLGRTVGASFVMTQAGDTIFFRENGVISQGYNPFYMRTLYTFLEVPRGKYNGVFYNQNGTRYQLTSASLGQISTFTQDWKTFKCTVPLLTGAYAEPCTVFLRRNFNDGTYLDSNPMVVDQYNVDLYGNQFQCSKVLDAPAYSPLLHNLAESQPHLNYTHSLPYSPVAVKNESSTIFGLLERYKLVMSHDQAKLLVKDNTNPVGALTYQLYKTEQQNAHAVLLTYLNDDLKIASEMITGEQPISTHSLGFLSANVARTDIVKNYAFGFKRMTFEMPPQNYQIGDVITINGQTGMIDNITETFTPAKWRQVLTALVA